jgi:hypothetical protein
MFKQCPRRDGTSKVACYRVESSITNGPDVMISRVRDDIRPRFSRG